MRSAGRGATSASQSDGGDPIDAALADDGNDGFRATFDYTCAHHASPPCGTARRPHQENHIDGDAHIIDLDATTPFFSSGQK